MGKPRRASEATVREYVRLLLAKAEEADLALGRRYVEQARRAAMKHRLRLTAAQRARFCPGCFTPWKGGTIRTRLVKGRRVTTCLACSRIVRQPVSRPPTN